MSQPHSNYTWSPLANRPEAQQGGPCQQYALVYGQGSGYATISQQQVPRTMPPVSDVGSDSYRAQAGSYLSGDGMDPATMGASDQTTNPQDDAHNSHRQYANEWIDNIEEPIACQQENGDPPESPRSRAQRRVHDVVTADYPGVSSSATPSSASDQRSSRHKPSSRRHNGKGKKKARKGDKE